MECVKEGALSAIARLSTILYSLYNGHHLPLAVSCMEENVAIDRTRDIQVDLNIVL